MGNWWSERTRGQKVGIVVGGLIAIGVLAPGGTSDPATPSTTTVAAAADTTPSSVISTESDPTTTTTRPTTTTTTAPATTSTVPEGSFGDGILLVGQDLMPGVYLNQRDGCYWARLSDPSGSFDAILANGNVSERAIVEVLETDAAFESSRCGLWVPYVSPTDPLSSFGDGIWAVGSDIAPGLYEANDVSGCYFARLSGFTGHFDDLVANANIDGRAVVDINTTDAGFESNRCGTWTSVDTSVEAPSPEPFGDGVHLVGIHIAPGRYRVENASNCYFARLSGVSGGFADIIANNNVDGTVTVDISPSDVAFESSRCGTWTPTN